MNQKLGGRTLRDQVALAACAAVLLLSAWIQTRVANHTEVIFPINADAGTYVAYAWNIREYGTFSRERTWKKEQPVPPTPDKLTLPGYPLFLAIFLDGKPDDAFVARVTTIQALLGVLTCLLVLMIAWRLLTPPWAITVGLLTAIHPHFATINTYLLTEGLFMLLLAASTYAAVRATQEPCRLRWYLACAALVALTSHVRPQLQLMPLILLVALAVSPTIRRHWRRVGAAVLLFVALMAPWQLRNETIERPAGEPDLLAATLYHGSFPDFMYRGDKESFGFPYLAAPDADQRTSSVSATLDWIGDEFERDPAEMTRWYLLGKPAYFVSWGIVAGLGDVFIYPIWRSPYLGTSTPGRFRWLSRTLYYPLVVLGLLSCVAGAFRPSLVTANPQAHNAVRMLSVALLTVIVVHMIGAPFPRYGIPFRWMLFLMAAFPLARLAGLFAPGRAWPKDWKARHLVTYNVTK